MDFKLALIGIIILVSVSASIGMVRADSYGFSVSPASSDVQADTGSFGLLSLQLSNALNESLHVNVSVDANARRFVIVKSYADIPANSSQEFGAGYFIPPTGILPGYQHANISFQWANGTEIAAVNFDIRDATPPSIGMCVAAPGNQNMTKQVEISCQDVYDNVNITSVLLQFEGETVPLIMSGRMWYANITPLHEGDFNATVTASDFSGNTAQFSIPFHASRYSPISMSDADFGKILYGNYHSRQIGYSDGPSDFYASVLDFNSTENRSVYIQTSSGSRVLSGLPAAMSADGPIYAEMFSDSMGSVRARIRIDYMNESYFSDLRANFTNYTIFPQRSDRWFGYPVTIVSYDGGNLENSTTVYTITGPLSGSNESGVIVPASFAGIVDYHKYDYYKSSASNRLAWAVTMTVLFILAFLGLVAYVVAVNW